MNERLKELAKRQAGSILMDLVMPDAGMPERVKWNIGCTTEHLEKFAELVIRECGYLANVFNALGCPDDMDPNDTKPSDYIKRYFGVEDEPR